MHEQITPVVITFNEEENIGRVLEQLCWAKRVIVVDSFSTDGTQAICERFHNVRFVQNEFRSPAEQFNFGAQLVETEWIFALGADYVFSQQLVDELASLKPALEANAFFVSFDYCIGGMPLRGSMYPPAALLYRRAVARFVQDGHTERLAFSGAAGRLRGRIRHDDRKPLARWLSSQTKYALLEAEKLLLTPRLQLNLKERLRKMIVLVPPLTLVYCLFYKGLILDGWSGVLYTLQRVYAELLLSLKLLDAKLTRRADPSPRRGKVSEEELVFVGGDSVADGAIHSDGYSKSASETPLTIQTTPLERRI
jgi:glycosyltransferase involved in cell wall biosynthesis